MWKESVSSRLPFFTFNMFFLMWKFILLLENTSSPVTRRWRFGVTHVSQMKFNPATETFPKSEIDFSLALLFSDPETQNS